MSLIGGHVPPTLARTISGGVKIQGGHDTRGRKIMDWLKSSKFSPGIYQVMDGVKARGCFPENSWRP